MDMGCGFVLLGGLLPRFLVFLIWIARPAFVNAAFDTAIVPLLGFLFLPFTTLMYLILFTPGADISGLDWVWLGLAVVLDVAHTGATFANRRYRPPPNDMYQVG
jgi:hypothetical protein